MSRDVASVLMEATSGGPHATLDAIGSAAVLRAAVTSLRHGGRHLLIWASERGFGAAASHRRRAGPDTYFPRLSYGQ